MPFILRRRTVPSLAEMVAVPQTVIVDATGPAIPIGEGSGAACIVAEFVKGSFLPTEPGSDGNLKALFGDTVFPYFSQGSSGIQNGTQVQWEGNGLIHLTKRKFKRLVVTRVDTEAVTADAGTTKGALTVTVTVAAVDQDGSSNTNKDIVIPAGTRFGSASTFAASTRVMATSGDYTIAKGTALTANAVAVSIPCFPVVVVEPVVATAIAAIAFVLDAVLPNVAVTTTITAVNNATTLWPPGTGTTLALRLQYQYLRAIEKTVPSNDVTADITAIWAARRTATIRQALETNVVTSSESGRGRVACVSADPAAGTDATAAQNAKTAAIGLVASDGYAQPADRMVVTFPQVGVKVSDLGDIVVYINGDGTMASTINNFPEEFNPGAVNEFIQGIDSVEPAFQNNPLSKTDYANLLAAGVSPIQKDRTVGWWFVDGRTAAPRATQPTRFTIKRRRMADLVQDSIGTITAPYSKGPASTERRNAYVGEIDAYLMGLKSPNQPDQQRIYDYFLDEKSGNSNDLEALGIFVLLVYVRILNSMDTILVKTQIGESVVVDQQAA